MRILVADDEMAVRDALGRALASEGYEVAFAGDGRETLLAVERDEPDAAVLDVMMPPPDGLEVCRRLRAADNPLPILLLTARREVSDRVAGLDAGGRRRRPSGVRRRRPRPCRPSRLAEREPPRAHAHRVRAARAVPARPRASSCRRSPRTAARSALPTR